MQPSRKDLAREAISPWVHFHVFFELSPSIVRAIEKITITHYSGEISVNVCLYQNLLICDGGDMSCND